MFGSQVLEVVVGLVFIYLLLSIICTAANEMISSLFSLRARNLAKGIANLLSDNRVKGLDELFYDHPLIKSLSRGRKKPSYIPAATFALAFLDGIAPCKLGSATIMEEIKTAVNGLPDDSELKRVLRVLLQQAGNDFSKFSIGIETWFNESMERVSGWYKRKSQLIILFLAILVTGLTNADTIQIVKNLSSDSVIRTAVAAQAQQWVKDHPQVASGHTIGSATPGNTVSSVGAEGGTSPPQALRATSPSPKETMTNSLSELQQLGIQLGWHTMPEKKEWATKVIGLLLTVFAVSLGAPFWFDLLNRISRIRSTGAAMKTAVKKDT